MPICFMIMPYGRKSTQVEKGKGPSEIDFNALWDKAYVPVIKRLGYEPIRADQDVGALIINQMLERLYFADLVLADVTIANGNVYYEIGIRHAAQRAGCVLLASDWSRGLFDVAQLRTVRYPMSEGDISNVTAENIREAIEKPIATLLEGTSPMFDAVKGYPDKVDSSMTSTMQDYLHDLAQLQGSIRSIRALPLAQRMVQAKALAVKYGGPPVTSPVAIALLRCLREAVFGSDDWRNVLDFIARLSPSLAKQAEFQEQRAFALSNLGDDLGSIAELEALIDEYGPTPERFGLLGGRFRRLSNKADAPGEKLRLLNLAIDAYERGMDLDLNEYYCSCNLPRLYRARNCKGDGRLAEIVLAQVMMSCDRALARGASDEYLPQTLLTSAFDAGDAAKAEEFAQRINILDPAPYKTQRLVDDLAMSASQVTNAKRRARLDAIVTRLRASLSP
ncbi:tetratricopeptide repeat-containing protein [Rhizobium ruizarguesonis]|uniref:tetratricopeptide repeat-containing protein n=1 Tax=Rhizobium ruizarguesonis TaxID=2081791 RepID=UPI001031315B|nr:tetratricopeptide repeat-containing protein [Rhizobium ruizarguesonis]NKL10884.1 hypothetical protein [Rhizobium leguminosarum bv. viciae]NEJ03096.1 hypothetical protein [Rhizobium ruizarguesonis]NEJ40212.1 hypothetical protein [Rhizobium ruizarguesonis]TAT91689.1 hypothetical protein ELI53_37335 [Rhizobium ruizarguesonis]TAZ03630.1 hypothetical protein ELH77_38565 [Rhizobium ruizarguesonis]